jgi:tricorn protease
MRGNVFTMGHWEGPTRQLGPRDASRQRLVRWLADGRQLIATTDRAGDDGIELLSAQTGKVTAVEADVGRVVDIAIDPSGRRVAMSNHRQQVLVLELESMSVSVIDQSAAGPICGLDWSPRGRWLAWSRPEGPGMATARILLLDTDDEAIHPVTDGRQFDWCPSFSPDGELLVFLARRDFDPVYDAAYFDANFPRSSRPWVALLRDDLAHPFRSLPSDVAKPQKAKGKPPQDPIKIDVDGLANRIVPMPVKESCYQRVVALPGGHVLMSRKGPGGSLDRRWWNTGPPKADHGLLMWDHAKREVVVVDDHVTSFGVDVRRKRAWITAGWKLRVLPAAPEKGRREELRKRRASAPSRTSGWIDLTRVRCRIDPPQEWRQIFDESWRLMRDHFWRADMGGVDWADIGQRYRALLPGVRTRSELTDLLWCLQGELGVGHAYVMGGDIRRAPNWSAGRLAADTSWTGDGHRVDHICRGDPGHRKRNSPLSEPGANVKVGDVIVAVDGQPMSEDRPLAASFEHRGDQLVPLTVRASDGKERTIVIRLLRDDNQARYRDHVRRMRERVHQATNGRCGYLHIPDMGPGGYAEFHRDFLVESSREGLVVDVRYNRGGHVSQLLLEKLSRRPLGYTISRHNAPVPYPRYAIGGPMICLTNAYSGSDGDIFSHHWKQLQLGPLVGTRTWGGVIGIWPRHRLVDNGLTTQPEFSNWMGDVGFGVENYGTDPDHLIEIKPQDWAKGLDPQLDWCLNWMGDALGGEALGLQPPADHSSRKT